MKRIFAFRLLCVTLVLLPMCSWAQWSVAHLSSPRINVIPLTVGQKVLFIGGEGADGDEKTVDLYDNGNGTWSQHQLPFPTSYFFTSSAAVIGHKALIVENLYGPSKEVALYDAASGVWSVDTLVEPVYGMEVLSYGGKVYILGINALNVYDNATDTWDTLHIPNHVPRYWVESAALDGKVFFAGGIFPNGGGLTGLSDRVDILDTLSGTWTTHTLGLPRALIESVSVGHKIVFAGGGTNDFYPFQGLDIYDAEFDQWTSGQFDLVDVVGLVTGVSGCGKAYFSNGGDQTAYNVAIYDPNTGQWDARLVDEYRPLHALARLGNKIFIAGGLGAITQHNNKVDILDCETDTWLPQNHLSVGRYDMAAATVGNKVLFAGGFSDNGKSDIVEIYTDVTNGVSGIQAAPLSISVAPIPATDMLRVHIQSQSPSAWTLLLHDAQGRLMARQDLENTAEAQTSFSLQTLPPGVYLLIVSNGQGYQTKKFVKP